MLNLKYSLSSWHHCWSKKGDECLFYKDYHLVIQPTSMVTVKQALGFGGVIFLPLLLSTRELRCLVIPGAGWLWPEWGNSQRLHPVCPWSMNISKGLEYHASFEKQVQLYPAWCLPETFRKQTRCYKYTEGDIHNRTKVSWKLLNMNQMLFSSLEKRVNNDCDGP